MENGDECAASKKQHGPAQEALLPWLETGCKGKLRVRPRAGGVWGVSALAQPQSTGAGGGKAWEDVPGALGPWLV